MMKRRRFIGLSALGITSLMLPGCMRQSSRKPNVVVIYTDDQEFNQMGCFGGRVLTPNINSIASDGVKFTRYYATSPVCSPSRYSVLTGRYAGHCKFLQDRYPTSDPAFIRWNTPITPGDKTAAQVFKANGYVTGMVGKYHLQFNEGAISQLPLDANPEAPEIKAVLKKNYDAVCNQIRETAGFDYAESIYGNNLHAIGVPKVLQEHNQEWVTKGALDFIDQNHDNPFFLYMATTLPHEPLPLKSMQSDPRITPLGYLDKAPNVQPKRENVMQRVRAAGLPDEAAPITWLDDGIGAVLKKLQEHGLTQNTLVFLASDHGSVRGKMTLYESGANAPAMIKWPGVIPAGKTIDAITANIDIAATAFDACGIQVPVGYQMDGLSWMPLVSGKTDKLRDSLMLEVTYVRGVVTKDWKYMAIRFPLAVREQITPANRHEFNQEGTRYSANNPAGKQEVRYGAQNDFPGYYDDDQLYHLTDDPKEQTNLANNPDYRAKLEEMQQLLKNYSKELPHKFGEF